MALARQFISMPFAGGLDTKTDALQIPIGKLLVLENATFASGNVFNDNATAAGAYVALDGITFDTR